MSASFSAVLQTLMLLVEASTAAPPQLPDCAASVSRIELSWESSGPTPEVCISADTPTTFRFDTPLIPGALEVQSRERFEDVLIGTSGFTVIAPADLRPGERLDVKVYFADGAAPRSATVSLVGHPVLSARRVDVFRHRRTVEDYQRENQEERQRSQRSRQELDRMRAENGPGGLTGLIASGLMRVDGDAQGVTVKRLDRYVTLPRDNSLPVEHVLSLSSNTTRNNGTQEVVQVAVVMSLRNPSLETWTLQGAALVPRGREPTQVKSWQAEPLLPASPDPGLVVAELELTAEEARGTFTLKAWDESGKRLITLGNVTFP